jgi:hypothetical protein
VPPMRALEQAQGWALERDGAVLATGSVYLIGDLMRGLGLHGGAPAATQAGLQGEKERAK